MRRCPDASPVRRGSRSAARAALVAFLECLSFCNTVSAASEMPASFLMIMTASTAPNIDRNVGIGGFRSPFGNSSSGVGSWLKTSGGLAGASVFAEDIADEKPDDKSPDSPWKVFHHDSLAFLLLPLSFVQRTLRHTTPALHNIPKRSEISIPSRWRRRAAAPSNHIIFYYNIPALQINRNQMDMLRLSPDTGSGLSAVSAPVRSACSRRPCFR